MRSTFDLEAALRRVKPAKRRKPLRRRGTFNFVQDDAVPANVGPVLLDTCVYLDAGRNTLPLGARRLVASPHLFHCSVCVGEIAYTFGRLDPTHADTPATRDFMREILGRVRAYRTVAPDSDDYVEAGIITGTLVRTQRLGRPERRKLLSDVLVFLTARRIGYPVLTANAKDFDLIQQLAPSGKALYYSPVAPPAPATSA
ncbi:MAG: type II toxin-antitoxin system VapC family toxin [Stellaceae bacterium]